MPFCHNCGIAVAANDAYCQECGAALHNDLDYSNPANKLNCVQSNVWGYIFTNIESLCSNLNCSKQAILSIIETDIKSRTKQGIKYSLIDASNYSYHSSELTVSLNSRNSWLEYQDIVLDSYNYDTNILRRNVVYLFIIGGNDIVPMPKVGNFIRYEGGDKVSEKIDSDLPYGALYGEQTDQMLIDMTICQVPHMLFVGRLPMGKDTSIKSLSASLKRIAAVAMNGLRIIKFYGQSDPHWKETSLEVAGRFANSYSFTVSNSYFYKNILLTPYIVSDREYDRSCYKYQSLSPLKRHFNNQASLYYFNMHGSNAPNSSGFYGQKETEEMFEGVTPNDLLGLKEPNVIVTEACYGARFIDKNIDKSMMLSAFENNTVIYFGSSRIAYGRSCGMSAADLMAHHFIKNLCDGYDAGSAMLLARRALIEKDDIHSEHSHITLSEFNLFGDPALKIVKPSATFLSADNKNAVINSLEHCNPRTIIYSNDDSCIRQVDHETIYETTQISGLRSVVENLVNRSIMHNHQMITKCLYERYGIPPRELSFVVKNSIGGTCKSYSYHYCNANNEIVVILDNDNNNVNKILISKTLPYEL